MCEKSKDLMLVLLIISVVLFIFKEGYIIAAFMWCWFLLVKNPENKNELDNFNNAKKMINSGKYDLLSKK